MKFIQHKLEHQHHHQRRLGMFIPGILYYPFTKMYGKNIIAKSYINLHVHKHCKISSTTNYLVLIKKNCQDEPVLLNSLMTDQ
jgi:hypothetical protein